MSVFFNKWYRHPPDLHSFPTRRSSDLHIARPPALARRGDVLETQGHGQRQGLRGGDRKSTRLNSSHANISYAVFCLKKKKANTPTARIVTRSKTSTRTTSLHCTRRPTQ